MSAPELVGHGSQRAVANILEVAEGATAVERGAAAAFLLGGLIARPDLLPAGHALELAGVCERAARVMRERASV